MPKFKAGDRVRCVDAVGKEALLVKGNIYTIRGRCNVYCTQGFVEILELPDTWTAAGSMAGGRFELVTRPLEQPDFRKKIDDELLFMLNQAVEARKELQSRHGEDVEILFEGKWLPNRRLAEAYRLKPKPKLTPFEIGGQGWEVSLTGEKLKVGCKTFDAKSLLSALQYLTAPGSTVNRIHQGDFTLMACRKGISCDGKDISWEDADKLLAALSEALAK